MSVVHLIKYRKKDSRVQTWITL